MCLAIWTVVPFPGSDVMFVSSIRLLINVSPNPNLECFHQYRLMLDLQWRAIQFVDIEPFAIIFNDDF